MRHIESQRGRPGHVASVVVFSTRAGSVSHFTRARISELGDFI